MADFSMEKVDEKNLINDVIFYLLLFLHSTMESNRELDLGNLTLCDFNAIKIG